MEPAGLQVAATEGLNARTFAPLTHVALVRHLNLLRHPWYGAAMPVPSPQRRTAFAVGCTAHIVQDGLSTAINVLLPILAQTFGLSYAQVGLLRGIKSLTQALFEVNSGWLAERAGEARLIAIGLALFGVGYAALSIAPGVIAIALCLAVVGVGTALHHAPSSALIVAAYSEQGRSGALGLHNASGDFGKLAFTGGVSLATGAGLAWQGISLIYGIGVLLTATALMLVTRTLRAQRTEAQNVAAPEDSVKGWGILNWRAFAALLAVTGVDTIMQSAVLLFVAFLMLAKGLPLYIATAATVVLLAGGVFGKAGCGYLAERLGVRRAFMLIQALTALGLVAIVLAPNWLALALLLPLGAVTQGSSSVTYGFAADLIHPAKMARGYALLYASGAFAAAGGPFVFGMIADRFGIETAIYGIAACAVLAALPIFLLPVRRSPA